MLVLLFGGLFGLIYFIAKVYELFTNKYFTNSRSFILLGIFGVAILASQIKPPVGWDLFRHFEEIEKIRELGAEYAWHKSRYSDYFCITALFYFVSLTPWNNALVVIAIFLDLLLLETVLYYYRKKGLEAQTASIAFFQFLVLSNIVLAISGIRNVLAVILMGFAVWNFHCNRKKTIILDMILALMAITIHPASGFIPLLYLVACIPTTILGSVCAMMLMPILANIMPRYRNSTNELLSSASGLFAVYMDSDAMLDRRVLIVSSFLLITTVFFLVYRILRLKDKTQYTKFSLIYCIGTLAMIGKSVIYSRMLYGVDFICLVLLSSETENRCDIQYRQMHYWYKNIASVYCLGMLAYQGLELWGAITYYM